MKPQAPPVLKSFNIATMASNFSTEVSQNASTNTSEKCELTCEGTNRTWITDEYGPEFMLSDSDYEQEVKTWPSTPITDASSLEAITKDDTSNTDHACLEVRSFKLLDEASTASKQVSIVKSPILGVICADQGAEIFLETTENREPIHEVNEPINKAERPQAAQYPNSPEEIIDEGLFSKHVYFDFSLVDEYNGIPFPRPPTFWEIYAIGVHFGYNCSNVIFACPFLVIIFEVLPQKPWPVTIAGLPVWITDTRSGNFPPLFGHQGTSVALSILDYITPTTYWKTPHTEVFDEIIRFFRWEGLDVRSLMFLGNRWLVTFRGNPMFYTGSLPSQAGGIPIFYSGEMDIFTPERNTESCMNNKIESSYYAELMIAGMMVCSSSNSTFTISGTPLYNEITEELCIVVSSHGFNISDTVYCPCTPDGTRKPIAVTFRGVEQTGIMLAPVKPRKTYIKEHLRGHCFFDKQLSGTEGLIVGTQLYRMESPWTEPCELVLVGIERTVEPGLQYAGGVPEIYQTNILTYTSNDLMFPDQYFCGAQIFDPLTRAVVGLFQCGRNTHGVFSSASVQPLLELGYQIPRADSDGLLSSVPKN